MICGISYERLFISPTNSQFRPFVQLKKTVVHLSLRTHDLLYTAVSRKVVGKSARDNPERYCGWFCLPCSPKKFERMAREATDICWRVLMESNKSRFDSYSREEQCIDHIPYYLSGLSRAHFPTTSLEIAVYHSDERPINYFWVVLS